MASVVEAEIFAAFDGVSREGTMSWNEASVFADPHATNEERIAARAFDRDTCWSDLIKDPDWDNGDEFCFLDSVGFRYYLPAAMIRCIRSGEDNGILFQLDLPAASKCVLAWNGEALVPTEVMNEIRPHMLASLSALDERQRHSIRMFLEFMSDAHDEGPVLPEANQRPRNAWRDALEGYWKDC